MVTEAGVKVVVRPTEGYNCARMQIDGMEGWRDHPVMGSALGMTDSAAWERHIPPRGSDRCTGTQNWK